MVLKKFNRTEDRGAVIINGHQVVAVFEAQEQTVVRTAAGGENISFVVTESAGEIAGQFAQAGLQFVQLTRKKDDKPLFINVSHIAGVYSRGEYSVIRTTAAAEHAEYAVPETFQVVADKLEQASHESNGTGSILSNILKPQKSRRANSGRSTASNTA
jgi:hypothetical protein